jgi:hypothetical protein
MPNRWKRLRKREGTPGPPATPKSGSPSTTRVPKQKRPPSAQSPSKPACHGDSSFREHMHPTLSAGGVGSYFPPSLPRGLTVLLSNAKSVTAQISSSTYHASGAEPDGDVEDSRCITAMPPSSSITRLSIPPAPEHKSPSPASLDDPTYTGLSKSATLLASLFAGSARGSRSIPDAFLTHHTPVFRSVVRRDLRGRKVWIQVDSQQVGKVRVSKEW